MPSNNRPESDTYEKDIQAHVAMLRRFQVVVGEFIVPAFLGGIMLAVLLVDQKGWSISLMGGAAMAALTAFVAHRFFVH